MEGTVMFFDMAEAAEVPEQLEVLPQEATVMAAMDYKIILQVQMTITLEGEVQTKTALIVQ
jgi:hypothetical protein